MARNKSKRPYTSGSVRCLRHGVAIRWREKVIAPDGSVRYKQAYENLGDVSKKEAELRLAEKQLANKRSGPRRDIPIPTFAEHAVRYERDILMFDNQAAGAEIEAPEAIYKYSTRYGRHVLLKKHLIPRFGKTLVSSITTADIQTFMTDLMKDGYVTAAGASRSYSAHSLNDIREVMRAVMNSSVAWYRQPVDPSTGIPVNPVVGVKLPKLKAKNPQWALTAEEAGALIHKLQGKAKVMAMVAILTGMRRGELLAFRLRDLAVHHEDGRRYGVVHVTEASYLGHVDTPKTEKGIRKIYIPPEVLELLERWTQLSEKTKPEHLLFGTRTNRIENSNNILRRKIYPVCAEMGLRHVNWVTCRRTFQTLAHNDLIPARTIADIMGHSDVDTQFIYNQPVESMMRVAADRLGKIVLSRIEDECEGEPALVH